MEEKVICTHCGRTIEEEAYDTIYSEPICPDCVADYTVTCDHCGAIIWDTDSISDESTVLCSECYDTHYTRCNDCNCVIHYDNAYEFEGEYYYVNAMTKFAAAIQSTITITSQRLFSMVTIQGILA